ncbi:MAG: hypothetical protein HON65_08290 [Rhodospirillales bacterium]|jgi:hypothetical protein|nr:hypothetical protein [Rhodospirillales bacterium]
MIYPFELLMMLIGLCGILVLAVFHHHFHKTSSSIWAVFGFCIFATGTILTVLEGFIWHDFLNYLEHSFYAISSISMAIWCWKLKKEGETDHAPDRDT